MSFLKTTKLLALSVGKSIGLFEALTRSEWRKNQLLILAYHGVSQADEHLWNPELYVSPEHFRGRMQALKDFGCNVLPLNDALKRLWAKTLPPCSVVITFDDGFSDFYSQALPILREFGWPSTVYLTSYYSGYNRPVFDVMCSYLLWKTTKTELDVQDLLPGISKLDLSSAEACEDSTQLLREYARSAQFSANQKDELLIAISARLAVDYQAILAKRLLHLLSEDELVELGKYPEVALELHTHRHHSPNSRECFMVEVEQNREFIRRFTKRPQHFAYPNGLNNDQCHAWLSASNVASATTCEPGLATARSNPYKLPRLVDTSLLQLVELEGWISGFSKFLPRKLTPTAPEVPPFYY